MKVVLNIKKAKLHGHGSRYLTMHELNIFKMNVMQINKFFLICIIGLFSCNASQQKSVQVAPNTLTGIDKKEGWQLLFDGHSLNGWHTFNKTNIGNAWKAEEGTLHLNGSKTDGWQTAGGGDIIYEKENKNFDLKIEWKISKAGNSGVLFYSQEGTQYDYSWQTGIESQVLVNINSGNSKIVKCRGGDLYELISSNADVVKPWGEWNQLEIICKDSSLVEILNGTTVISITLWDDKWKELIALSKFKHMPGFGMFKTGKIALQDEGNDVWYRNIMIKEL